jgi:hypothetical protein
VHVQMVHETSLKPYACKICSSSFGLKTSLRQHVQTVHENLKPLQCKIYFAAFGTKDHLKQRFSTWGARTPRGTREAHWGYAK